MFSRIWYWCIQSIIWPASWLAIHFFYSVEIRGKENFAAAKTPLIVVSNHRSFIDTFLIGTAFPWFSRFFPLRFMAEEMEFIDPILQFLMRIKLLKFIYIVFGGFPSLRGVGVENAISLPLELLAKKQNIALFPEGKMNLDEGLGIFYPGAAALALKSQAEILPIGFVFSQKKIQIAIGQSFKLNQSDTIESGTSLIRQRVEALLK